MTLRLILAILAALHTGADKAADAQVVDAIAHEAQTPEEAALLTVYAWHESRATLYPEPYSWDARAGLSCGPWQLRCWLVEGRGPRAQARLWLAILRRYGLTALDSSRARAERRRSEALAALKAATGPKT